MMSDFATPNLPSRDFERTSQFYGALGFVESWRGRDWMILKRGELTLEFFPHPELDPLTSLEQGAEKVTPIPQHNG